MNRRERRKLQKQGVQVPKDPVPVLWLEGKAAP